MFRLQLHQIFIFLILLINFSLPARADTFIVTSLNDSGPGSLRQAVLDANANLTATHTIEFQPGLTGTIILTSGEITIAGRMTINGPGESILAVSGNNTSRVFNVTSVGATLRGLTIKDGKSSGDGGGIYNSGSLTLSDIILSGNKASGGGGIHNTGPLTATRLTLSGNEATSYHGGGIHHSSSSNDPVIISNSTFTNNRASNGGGIYLYPGAITVSNSTLSGNQATNGHGGGIHVGGNLIVTHSTLSENSASHNGGGIYHGAGTLTVINSTLSGNVVNGSGGGIRCFGTTTITNSTLSGNMALTDGGGISNGATLTLSNSIVAGNTALVGQNLNNTSFLESSSNLFGENGVSGVEGATPLPNEIIAGPLSSVIGPLADNGGPTKTHALVAGSSAIEKGNNSLIPNGIATDQRGNGFPRIVGGSVDIGAVEGVGGGAGNNTNLIVNGSFEEGNYYDAQGFQRLLPNDTALSGWLIGGSGADWHVGTPNPSQNPLFVGAHLGPAQDGSLVVDLNLDGESTGTLSQTFATNVGTTYTVSFYMAGVDLFTNPRAVQVTVNGVARTFSQTVSPQYQLVWGLKSFEFTATQSRSTLTFSSPNMSGVWGPLIDNVSVLSSNPSVTHTLTVTKNGTGGGTVTSNPSGIDCGFDCSESYSANTTVTLTAKPSSFDVKPLSTGSQQVFAGWSGVCSGTSPSCTVTMDAAKSVTATFNSVSSPTYTLTVTKNGTGSGTVTATGINCGSDCTGNYDSGTSITLTATAATGSTFAGWNGACSGTGACTLMMDQTKSVTALFTHQTSNTYTLTVSKAGTGSGTITSTGINCGSDCTESYAGGASVTLTPIAASGSSFAGWSGACINTSGACVISMTTARSVTAIFNSESTTPNGNRSAVGVFRAGTWFLDANGNGQWDNCRQDGGQDACLFNSFGQSGDLPAAGDWNGDGKGKVGVFRNGTWYLDYNGNDAWDGCGVDQCYVGSFGQFGDWPAAGDWNGDGKAKVGVFRNGTWFLDYNGNGAWDGCGVDKCYVGSFGQFGDLPAAGDWNGDGRAKVGVFRNGTWFLDYNGNGAWDGCGVDKCYVGSFGMTGDLPAAGDWNGDGKGKVGVFRNGTWFLDYNGNGAWDGCQQDGGQDQCLVNSFGQSGDMPVTIAVGASTYGLSVLMNADINDKSNVQSYVFITDEGSLYIPYVNRNGAGAPTSTYGFKYISPDGEMLQAFLDPITDFLTTLYFTDAIGKVKVDVKNYNAATGKGDLILTYEDGTVDTKVSVQLDLVVVPMSISMTPLVASRSGYSLLASGSVEEEELKNLLDDYFDELRKYAKEHYDKAVGWVSKIGDFFDKFRGRAGKISKRIREEARHISDAIVEQITHYDNQQAVDNAVQSSDELSAETKKTYGSREGDEITVTATAGANGLITPASQTVSKGATASFMITPNSGYIASVSGCGGPVLNGTTYVTFYTTGVITAACTVTATFSPNVSTYTVTATAGANGSITPTSRTVSKGATTSFTVTPNSGYTASVSGCGGTLNGTTYTTGIITAACTVTAAFSLNASTYTVTATTGANGSITPTSRTVSKGATTSFTVTPNSGYTASVSGCGGTLNGTTYTTGIINAACTVTAAFSPNVSTYTVTATTGANGSITPTSRTVSKGATTSFTVTPNSGYTASVSGCGGTLNGTTYTTGIITAACTVTATFSQGGGGGGGGGCIEGQIIQVNGINRYRVVGSDCSIVRDLVTNLEWQRCSVGQTWNVIDQRCDGRSRYIFWDEALTLTAPGGFRLPTITELRSLVYCSNTGVIGMNTDLTPCGEPRSYQIPTIVWEAFPWTDDGSIYLTFWASSSSLDSGYAWYVSFGNGYMFPASTFGSNISVLLVRNRQ